MPVLDPHTLAMPVADDPSCAAFVFRLLRSRWRNPGADPRRVARFATAAEGAIVFVALHHGNFPSLEYMAHALADAGQRTVAVYLQGEPPPHTFTDAIGCDGSLARLAEVLAALPSETIYLQAHGRWSFLGQFCAAVNPHLRVVQELWDWMDAFVEPEHEQAFVDDGVFSAEEIAMMRISERWVRTSAAGFVHKHGGAALDAVVADARVPEVRIVPCPPRAWARPPVPARTGPWRLVHAGQIKPSSSSRRIFGDLHVRPTIQTLTAQSLHVTAYAAALPGGIDEMLGEYVEVAANDPGFRLEPRLPVQALVDALHGRHHYGILLYPFDDDLVVGRRHLQTALASKLFVYLAAGLPVLVSPELGYMAELVRAHGIGLVVPREELATLAERLDDVDHTALCGAVARAQPEFCIERHLPAVLRLVTGSP
jgi:hypothetical protein